MKKLSALLLSLLLLLTACGTPATPGDAATLPTPNDEILVEEGLRAEDLPEVCRLWFDLAETSGAADKSSSLPLASRADEGACDYRAVRLPDGTYTDLIQEGKLADEGVTLADFSGGRAKQEGSYGQLAWNGELYHAFTVSAADCTLPNLTAPDGGILRLNISGDCTVDGGGTEYACFEGFDCVLVTGGGTLTVLNAAALDCGGGDLPIPSLVLDGDVTLRCDDIRLTAPNTVDVPALAVLGGTLCTDMLWLSNGMLVNAGGTLSVQGSVQELKRAVFRGGTTRAEGGIHPLRRHGAPCGRSCRGLDRRGRRGRFFRTELFRRGGQRLWRRPVGRRGWLRLSRRLWRGLLPDGLQSGLGGYGPQRGVGCAERRKPL